MPEYEVTLSRSCANALLLALQSALASDETNKVRLTVYEGTIAILPIVVEMEIHR